MKSINSYGRQSYLKLWLFENPHRKPARSLPINPFILEKKNIVKKGYEKQAERDKKTAL